MKNILVTGGMGFIGFNLIKRLIRNNYKVISIDNLSRGSDKNRVLGCEYIINDVNHIKNIKLPKIDVIIHLSAFARIQPSFSDPEGYWRNNCEASFNLINYASNNKIPIIYSGTSSHYAGRFSNPYTFTKDIVEDVIELYRIHYGLKSTIVRFYNVYGPGECVDENATLIGRWKKNYLENLPLVIYGDGSKTRDFTHVDDIVDALLKIIEKDAFGYVFELGRNKSHSVKEIFELFEYNKVEYKQDRDGENLNSICMNDTANKILDWHPFRDIEDYIKFIKDSKIEF
jgi:UDP-glucose 4-epimerase